MKLNKVGLPLVILALGLASARVQAQISTNSLRLWLRADAGIALNGSTVTNWADQSGHGYDASQATTSLQPTYQASVAAFNGKPGLLFPGGKFVNGSVTTLNTPFTLFLVGLWTEPYPVGTGDYQYMFQMGNGSQNISISRSAADSSPGAGDSGLGQYTNSFYSATVGAPAFGALIGPYVKGATPTLYSYVWSNGLPYDTIYVNGHSNFIQQPSSPLASVNGNYEVGATAFGGYYLKGQVAEVILYDGALSGSSLLQVEDYLGDKYNLVVPEPNTAALFAAAAGLLCARSRKR